jgi:hypothetical protein
LTTGTLPYRDKLLVSADEVIEYEFLLRCMSLFLAQSGHANHGNECPVSGLKRTPANHGHFTTGGSDDRIDSTLPPVRKPKMVPRSYSRLNSA